MNDNRQTPYCGELPYIFLSYSHKNIEPAMEIIEKLWESGYRVWYDEGIDPGSEWDENIASHIEACGFFIALLSREYLDSTNCKDELNFARETENPRLLIYLEDIELPSGMKMRLGRLQAIHKYKYENVKDFCKKLFSAPGLEKCRDKQTAADSSDQDVNKTAEEINIPYFGTALRSTKVISPKGKNDPENGIERPYLKRCRELGEDHPDTLKALSTLASLYAVANKYKKALELEEKCYEARKRVLGENHSGTLTSLSKIAMYHVYLGDYEKAIELGEKCYGAMCRILGEEHPDTLDTLRCLAHYYCMLDDSEKAVELGEKYYSSKCKIQGEEDPDTLEALEDLAGYYSDLGRDETAVKLEEECYEKRYRVLGEDHPDTLRSLGICALSYSIMHKYKKAVKYGEKHYEAMCRLYGEKDERTIKALNDLIEYYSSLGNDKKVSELKNKRDKLKK